MNCDYCRKPIPDSRSTQSRYCKVQCQRRDEKRKRTYVRTCERCSSQFSTPTHTIKYCGPKCRAAAKAEYNAIYRERGALHSKPKGVSAMPPLADQPRELRRLHPIWAQFVRVQP